MSYISGEFNNFEERLHAYTTSVADLALFKLEAYNMNYTGQNYISKAVKNQWNREFIKKGEILNFPTGIPTLFP